MEKTSTHGIYGAVCQLYGDSGPPYHSKSTQAHFCLTMDFLPVNDATVPTVWLIANKDAELQDTRSLKIYVCLDFFPGYW